MMLTLSENKKRLQKLSPDDLLKIIKDKPISREATLALEILTEKNKLFRSQNWQKLVGLGEDLNEYRDALVGTPTATESPSKDKALEMVADLREDLNEYRDTIASTPTLTAIESLSIDKATKTWKFDPAHTVVTFSARHMMVTTVHGRFAPPTGILLFDPANPSASYVEAEIDATTISTGADIRDNHLKSADFLEVDKFPTITFKSTKVEVTGENEGKITGDLTIHGVTRSVILNAEHLGLINSPFGDTRAGFTASTKINREDWGLTYNMAMEAGGYLAGKELKIAVDLEAILIPRTENEMTKISLRPTSRR